MTTSCQKKVSLRNATGISHSRPQRSRIREPIKLKPSKNPTQGGGFTWCSIVDAFQTAAIDAQEDYKLKYLVEQFQLEGSLI
jgi:hypothetical protein